MVSQSSLTKIFTNLLYTFVRHMILPLMTCLFNKRDKNELIN